MDALKALGGAAGGKEAADDDVVIMVEIKTTKPGDATHFPKKGQTCRVHYEAFLSSDGSKFDSSRDRGLPFEFVLGKGHVIPGWEKTLPKMSLGQIVTVIVPPELAYGKRGYPPIVPQNETLNYEIELIAFD